jgi:hypothetical protein
MIPTVPNVYRECSDLGEKLLLLQIRRTIFHILYVIHIILDLRMKTGMHEKKFEVSGNSL